jgi:hypothetical protein
LIGVNAKNCLGQKLSRDQNDNGRNPSLKQQILDVESFQEYLSSKVTKNYQRNVISNQHGGDELG